MNNNELNESGQFKLKRKWQLNIDKRQSVTKYR